MVDLSLRPFTTKSIRLSPWAIVMAMLLALWFGPGDCSAQTDQGSITGIVLDTSGALIANAQVTVTNVDTGLVLQAKSNGRGVFVFSPLKIGNYTLTGSSQGLETVTRENLHLDAQQRLSVNLTLPAGSISQTVQVNSAAPLLQTQDAAVGQVIPTSAVAWSISPPMY